MSVLRPFSVLSAAHSGIGGPIVHKICCMQVVLRQFYDTKNVKFVESDVEFFEDHTVYHLLMLDDTGTLS